MVFDLHFQRFPRVVSQHFHVMVYFSVLCPMQEDGMPPTGIEYHELEMNTLGLFSIFVQKYARRKDELLFF